MLVLMVDSQSDFCCTISLLVLSRDHLSSSRITDVREYAVKTKFHPSAIFSTNYRTTDQSKLKTVMSLAVEGQNLVLKVSQNYKCAWIIFQFHEEVVKK